MAFRPFGYGRSGAPLSAAALLKVARRPLPTANATTAAVFRVIEMAQPTLLMDEADTFLKDDNTELRGILNSGHRRWSASVMRTVGDDHEPRRFSTWAAVAIAMIGRLPRDARGPVCSRNAAAAANG